MALVQQITGVKFGEIGQVGQTPNFSDFTQAQIDSDGFAQIVQRYTDFNRVDLFTGINTDADGKVELVNRTNIEVALYMDTIFDTVGKTVNSKVFITNVEFGDEALPSVINKDSKYVDRTTTVRVYWTSKVQVV